MICPYSSSYVCPHVENDDPDVCSVCRAGEGYSCEEDSFNCEFSYVCDHFCSECVCCSDCVFSEEVNE